MTDLRDEHGQMLDRAEAGDDTAAIEAAAIVAKSDRADDVIAAAQAMSDLNTFYIVISTMENGHLHAPSYRAAERVIAICKSEALRRLMDYDRATARALAPKETGK